MNRNAAELVFQAVSMIELETYLKKMKVNEEDEIYVDKVQDFIKYEIMRCIKDLVIMERL